MTNPLPGFRAVQEGVGVPRAEPSSISCMQHPWDEGCLVRELLSPL